MQEAPNSDNFRMRLRNALVALWQVVWVLAGLVFFFLCNLYAGAQISRANHLILSSYDLSGLVHHPMACLILISGQLLSWFFAYLAATHIEIARRFFKLRKHPFYFRWLYVFWNLRRDDRPVYLHLN